MAPVGSIPMHFRHFLFALWGQSEASSGQTQLFEKGLGQTAKEPNVEDRSEPDEVLNHPPMRENGRSAAVGARLESSHRG